MVCEGGNSNQDIVNHECGEFVQRVGVHRESRLL